MKTVTGLVVTDVKSGKRFEGCDVASLAFRDIPEEIIDKLIEKGDAMYCAGGITVEDSLLEPYRRELKGEMESIQGLPITLLRQLLAKAGI